MGHEALTSNVSFTSYPKDRKCWKLEESRFLYLAHLWNRLIYLLSPIKFTLLLISHAVEHDSVRFLRWVRRLFQSTLPLLSSFRPIYLELFPTFGWCFSFWFWNQNFLKKLDTFYARLFLLPFILFRYSIIFMHHLCVVYPVRFSAVSSYSLLSRLSLFSAPPLSTHSLSISWRERESVTGEDEWERKEEASTTLYRESRINTPYD